MIKETGIIMSGDHPRLILDLIKSQTRRTYGLEFVNQEPDAWQFIRMENGLAVFLLLKKHRGDLVPARSQSKEVRGKEPNLEFLIKCPYDQVGSRLWVRETWATMKLHDSIPPREIKQSTNPGLWYKADSPQPRDTNCNPWPEGNMGKWRPSIFMPRWASRILLEITGLRAERLRAASLADAIAEGFKTVDELIKAVIRLNHLPDDADPWVWPISFKVVAQREGLV